MELADKTIVVVGGGSGIGREVALGLAEAGAAVAVVGDVGTEADIAGKVAGGGGRAVAVTSSLSSRQEGLAVFEAAASQLGPVDGLVFAHLPPGATESRPLMEVDEQEWDLLCEGLARSTLFCCQAAHDSMADRGGSIVVVCASVALTGAAGLTPYLVAAEAQRLLIKSAARAWGSKGIVANVVAIPLSKMADGPVDLDGPLVVGTTALERPPDGVRDIAPIVGFLLGAEARYVTGTTICADGGMVMAP